MSAPSIGTPNAPRKTKGLAGVSWIAGDAMIAADVIAAARVRT